MIVSLGIWAAAYIAGSQAAEPSEALERVTAPRSDAAFPLKQPPYPAESRRRGHDGIVSLLVLVDTDGSVVDQRVAASTGHSELDASALLITRSWKLKPGTVNGVPTKMWALFALTFSVEGKSKPTMTEQHHAASKFMTDFYKQMEAAAARSDVQD
jgi:TonB family protein